MVKGRQIANPEARYGIRDMARDVSSERGYKFGPSFDTVLHFLGYHQIENNSAPSMRGTLQVPEKCFEFMVWILS